MPYRNERLSSLLLDLQNAANLSSAEFEHRARRAAWIGEWTPAETVEFFAALSELPLPLSSVADRLLARWLSAAVQTERRRSQNPLEASNNQAVGLPAVETLYRELGSASQARGQLLAWLAIRASLGDLDLFARLLADHPPQGDQDVVQALAPLFQARRDQASRLFPRLFDALSNPLLAAPILDLANFLTRERIVAQHPASERAEQLCRLLGDLVQSLEQLDERCGEPTDSPSELSRRVARGVALAVSLCDALALIGNRDSIGKLYQALEVPHRRVRTEAAAALARLGEEQGTQALLELAAEPVTRLRVLAYAEELGIPERVEPQFTTPEARAQAELCAWLAEATQYGLPPTSCELVDHRRQLWPGYDQPIDCYLFRFQYVVKTAGDGERSFSNIGIAGPLAHAFIADLGDLPPDDIYAAFAGWQAQHADIREFDVARLSKSEQLEAERLKRRLIDAGFANIEPQRMGYFFGDKALIALARRQGVEGVAVVDFQDTAFFPRRYSRPIGNEEAYSIYKGRKLLASFNRQFGADSCRLRRPHSW